MSVLLKTPTTAFADETLRRLLPLPATLALALSATACASSTNGSTGSIYADASPDSSGTTKNDAGTDSPAPTLCGPNALRCDGQQPEQCDSAGDAWLPIGSACSNQACVVGACIGTCEPGTTRCNGDLVQTCDSTGNLSLAMACPQGDACNADAGGCTGGCFIEGTYYAAGAPDPSNACQTCQPATTTTAWTTASDGTSCALGACCDGACMQIGTDIDNCGACGAVCDDGLGAACNDGWCNYTLATEQTGVLNVAVNAAGVYWTVWTEDTSVLTVPLSGGPPTTLDSTSQVAIPYGVAASSTDVYWIAANGLIQVPIGGGSSSYLTGDGVTSVAVDATSVYWIDVDGDLVTSPFGGPARTIAATGQWDAVAIAVNATNVYYGAGPGGAAGPIMTVPIGGGTPTTIASGSYYPLAIAADATNVYWMSNPGNAATSTVMMVPLAGGTPTTIATAQNATVYVELGSNPVDIAVDATSLYWTDTGAGTVVKVPVGGGTPTTIASGQSSPQAIALDATNVYWANVGNGSIMKAPKQ